MQQEKGQVVKVYELAKELNMETIALMDKIKSWGLPVRSHMSKLDEDVLVKIKAFMADEKKSATTTKKKKVVKKKATKKKTTKKASTKVASTAVKKTAVKSSATKKATVKKASAPAVEASAVKKKKTVIRRSAAVAKKMEEEQLQTEAAEIAAVKIEQAKAVEVPVTQEATPSVEATLQEQKQVVVSEKVEVIKTEVAKVNVSDTAVVASVPAEAKVDLPEEAKAGDAPAASAPATKRPALKKVITRKNIIGRIDLAKFQKKTRPQTSRPSRPGSGGPSSGGPKRTNLRSGFVAPAPALAPGKDATGNFKRREDRKKKPDAPGGKPSSAAPEQKPASFAAADFRKREMIFQPKRKRTVVAAGKSTEITTPAAHKRVVKVNESMPLSELAQTMGVKASQVVKVLMKNGVMANMNTSLDFDTVSLVVPEFKWEAESNYQSVDDVLETAAFGNLDAEAVKRPAVVTVMGHVDHGKTTLLDRIRKANVVKGEAGGITQHIGAYQVTLDSGELISFIDTPGHAAFTAMRARGAHVTDIVILVVAADDGAMPQTIEAINHAKAAGVPIIVAVNKMDKEGANPDKIKQQLSEYELVPEDWGGQTQFCHVSAIKGEGIKELLENVLLVAEVEDYKANPKRSASGVVIESRVEKGRGNVVTLLVQQGTLKKGDYFSVGSVSGRVRGMVDEHGKPIKEAGPSKPVEVYGLSDSPLAGDLFDVCKNEKAADELSAKRQEIINKAKKGNKPQTAEELMASMTNEQKDLSIILKADVVGSIEAVKGMLAKLKNEEVATKVVHSAVGGISESDILLAQTCGGLVLGFNVRPDSKAQAAAKVREVDIKTYTIIYELIDDVKKALAGLLDPDVVDKDVGKAEVREVFTVPKIGAIAGCIVTDGKIARSNMLRLVRDGRVVYEGKVSSLKRFKDDAKEVANGYECGIGIENFNDIKEGDVIEAFIKEDIKRELKIDEA